MRMTRHTSLSSQQVGYCKKFARLAQLSNSFATDKKAREELAKKAGGKGPLNTGSQGIKKSGKK
jgi:hypothetical protein